MVDKDDDGSAGGERVGDAMRRAWIKWKGSHDKRPGESSAFDAGFLAALEYILGENHEKR